MTPTAGRVRPGRVRWWRARASTCRRACLGTCAAILLAPAAAASDPVASLNSLVPGLLRSAHVPSVSIARIEHGRLAFAVAFGEQSPGVRATPATLYNVASLTKPITAEVILRLVASGRLSLDEPMYRYWTDPDIATDERRKLLTPRLALSHRTGFPNWRPRGMPLTFNSPPGAAYGYSGEGFEYLARFAEKKSGVAFETLAQRLVLSPAHMNDTAYTSRPWFAGRIAIPADASGAPLVPESTTALIASDLLYTTATDYARFMVRVIDHVGIPAALANERERVQVSRKAAECPPAKAAVCPRELGFGLGWEVYEFAIGTVLMHTGMDTGLFTFVCLDPSNRSGTVILTSGANGAEVVLPVLEAVGHEPGLVAFLRTAGK